MEDKLQWKFILLIDAPRQLNGFDCGMFCVKFAEAMSCKCFLFKNPKQYII